MDFSQLGNGHGGVDLRGVEFRVAEQLLDKTDVGSAFEQMRRASMPQQMTAAGFAEVGGVDHLAHPVAKVAGGGVTVRRIQWVLDKQKTNH